MFCLRTSDRRKSVDMTGGSQAGFGEEVASTPAGDLPRPGARLSRVDARTHRRSAPSSRASGLVLPSPLLHGGATRSAKHERRSTGALVLPFTPFHLGPGAAFKAVGAAALQLLGVRAQSGSVGRRARSGAGVRLARAARPVAHVVGGARHRAALCTSGQVAVRVGASPVEPPGGTRGVAGGHAHLVDRGAQRFPVGGAPVTSCSTASCTATCVPGRRYRRTTGCWGRCPPGSSTAAARCSGSSGASRCSGSSGER